MTGRPEDEIPDLPAGLKRGKDNKSELTKKEKPRPVETHPPEKPVASLPVGDINPPDPPKATAAKATSKPPKVTEGVDEFGIRKGTDKSKAAAMYSAGNGATLKEVEAALGRIHFNVLTQLGKKGFRVEKTLEGEGTKRKITRYRLYPK
jgi:hypothetical protein